jgi:hypothetical protein
MDCLWVWTERLSCGALSASWKICANLLDNHPSGHGKYSAEDTFSQDEKVFA